MKYFLFIAALVCTSWISVQTPPVGGISPLFTKGTVYVYANPVPSSMQDVFPKMVRLVVDSVSVSGGTYKSFITWQSVDSAGTFATFDRGQAIYNGRDFTWDNPTIYFLNKKKAVRWTTPDSLYTGRRMEDQFISRQDLPKETGPGGMKVGGGTIITKLQGRTVEKCDTLSTKAGAFAAWKIPYKINTTTSVSDGKGDTSFQGGTEWYASGTGLVKWDVTLGGELVASYELVSITQGK